MSYSSHLTDEEWEIFEPVLLQMLPHKKRTRPWNWSKREIFDGIPDGVTTPSDAIPAED
jgi:hypothetical protein